MTRLVHAFGSSLLVLGLLAPRAEAQDSAIGTFTVDGRTTRFVHVYATLATDPR